jgi:CheY-like chemotaxis protein
VVKSLTDLVLARTPKDDPIRKYLEPISDSSTRGINLVQQLLYFSRNQPADAEDVNMNDTSLNLLSMLEHLISEDITITTHLSYNLWNIKADNGRIEQLITNLVINGSEAMPQGGKVVLKTENVNLSEKNCKNIPGARAGRYVRLTVEDTGVGMDKEVMEHIFEPFFTTKATRGTGMGLAIVYGIVKECGGWINVASEPGEGSSFRVYLPAATGVVKKKAAEKTGMKFSPGKGKRILLVEDEKWVRKSTAMVLTEHGYAVFEAANAENAIGLFYREKGRFDLVLSDVVMPGRNGLQLVGPLLDINPRIPILLASAHFDDKAQLSQIIKRGLPYIQKPYEIPDLLRAVEETMKQE